MRRQAGLDMGERPRGGTFLTRELPQSVTCAVQSATAQPFGAFGFARGTASPTCERETLPSEFESHTNNSLKESPRSFKGSRTDICFRRLISAPSTPTE